MAVEGIAERVGWPFAYPCITLLSKGDSVMPETVIFTLRLPKPLKDGLVRLARATDRTQAYLCTQAIEEYLEAQAWQVQAIEEAVRKADSPEARFTPHEEAEAHIRRLADQANKARR